MQTEEPNNCDGGSHVKINGHQLIDRAAKSKNYKMYLKTLQKKLICSDVSM
jgi:hypothetical protein